MATLLSTSRYSKLFLTNDLLPFAEVESVEYQEVK